MPVLQAVVATTKRAAWADSPRGLGAADLAMHVVLPELDGRVLAGVVAFKAPSETLRRAGLHRACQPARGGSDRRGRRSDRGLGASAGRRRAPSGASRCCCRTIPARRAAPAMRSDSTCRRASTRCSPISPTAGYAVSERAGVVEGAARCGGSRRRVRCRSQPIAVCLRNFRLRVGEKINAAWGAPGSDPDVRDGAFHFRAQHFRQRHRRLAAGSRPARTAAAPIITIHLCRRAMRCLPSGCGSAMSLTSMPSSTWVRTAPWNGCQAKPLL